MVTVIDETVIMRYLLDDDRKLSKLACEVIGTGEALTYPEIFARVAVSLRDVYGVPRSLIGAALVDLLDDITVAEEDVVRYASRLFGTTTLDYVDCLLVARNALRGLHVVSLDKAMMRKYL